MPAGKRTRRRIFPYFNIDSRRAQAGDLQGFASRAAPIVTIPAPSLTFRFLFIYYMLSVIVQSHFSKEHFKLLSHDVRRGIRWGFTPDPTRVLSTLDPHLAK